MDFGRTRFAITFGDVACTHIGGQEHGFKAREGFTCSELKSVRCIQGEWYDLSANLPDGVRERNEAGLLVIRNFTKPLGETSADYIYNELKGLEWDKKYWDVRRSATLNKRARYNTTFGDFHQAHSEDFKVPTVHSYESVPGLSVLRQYLPMVFGRKAEDLPAEGNFYYEEKSGIGYHGDRERKKVICLSLGKSTGLFFGWRSPGSSNLYGNLMEIPIHHGDLYVMSEKATGSDWLMTSQWRLVHAAGNEKYTQHK